MRIFTAAALIIALAGCGSDANTSQATTAATTGATSAAPDNEASSTAPTVSTPEITDVPVATESAPSVAAPGDGPVSDPCALLTALVATQVLGGAVGAPISTPGEGNATCTYHSEDPAAHGFVYLTTYTATGTQAVLDQAALSFPDAKAVEGVGDAAQVSPAAQAIGVLFGDTVFGLGLVLQSSDGQLLPVGEDQLIAAAQAVLSGQ